MDQETKDDPIYVVVDGESVLLSDYVDDTIEERIEELRREYEDSEGNLGTEIQSALAPVGEISPILTLTEGLSNPEREEAPPVEATLVNEDPAPTDADGPDQVAGETPDERDKRLQEVMDFRDKHQDEDPVVIELKRIVELLEEEKPVQVILPEDTSRPPLPGEKKGTLESLMEGLGFPVIAGLIATVAAAAAGSPAAVATLASLVAAVTFQAVLGVSKKDIEAAEKWVSENPDEPWDPTNTNPFYHAAKLGQMRVQAEAKQNNEKTAELLDLYKEAKEAGVEGVDNEWFKRMAAEQIKQLQDPDYGLNLTGQMLPDERVVARRDYKNEIWRVKTLMEGARRRVEKLTDTELTPLNPPPPGHEKEIEDLIEGGSTPLPLPLPLPNTERGNGSTNITNNNYAEFVTVTTPQIQNIGVLTVNLMGAVHV